MIRVMNYILAIGLLGLVLSEGATVFAIKSSAFQNGGKIPIKYTCDSLDVSPSLSWTGAPAETKSFVIVCDDPDAPTGVFVHWVIFNIPKEKTGLEENTAQKGLLPEGTVQGKNDFGRNTYMGPCPPPGKPHRYFFKLYALDIKLPLGQQAKKSDVEKAMKDHILAETQIFGLYQR